MNFKNGWGLGHGSGIANIETPLLTTNFVCLTFWYNMPSNYSNLNVSVKQDGVMREIWKREVYFSGKFVGWHNISLAIYEDPPFSVRIYPFVPHLGKHSGTFHLNIFILLPEGMCKMVTEWRTM